MKKKRNKYTHIMKKKRNKYTHISIKDLPAKAQEALRHYRAAFLESGPLNITHVRRDAIFVQHYGILNPYLIARFINNAKDFYIEIDAKAPRYIEIRIFFSDWMTENEVPRQRRLIERPYNLYPDAVYSVRVRNGNFTKSLQEKNK